MSKKKLSIIICCFLCLWMLGGCGKQPEKHQEKKVEQDDKIEIGLAVESFVIERWEKDRDIFIATANENGATVNVQNSNGSVEEQKKQIEYFIDQGMDVIVIIAVDSDALEEEISKAHDRGIKVIAYDRQINNADVDLYITFDNEKVGALMGEELALAIEDGANVLMISGPLTDSNVHQVNEGFMEEAKKHRWNIVDTFYTQGWDQDLAYDYISTHLDEVQNVEAIMCGNDALAGKVINALSKNRLLDGRYVVGQDADLEACQRVVEGTQYRTIYKPINSLASQAAEYAVAMAKGKNLSFTGKIDNGSYVVPYVAIRPYEVGKDNIDIIVIESGFHQRSEVYLNVK